MDQSIFALLFRFGLSISMLCCNVEVCILPTECYACTRDISNLYYTQMLKINYKNIHSLSTVCQCRNFPCRHTSADQRSKGQVFRVYFFFHITNTTRKQFRADPFLLFNILLHWTVRTLYIVQSPHCIVHIQAKYTQQHIFRNQSLVRGPYI